MKPTENPHLKVLTPYDPQEGISLATAAKRAGKKPRTMRGWCLQHALGRRIGGGVWVVSQVALAMFLEGDRAGLAAYHSGDRSSERVRSYFERFGVRLSPKKAA